MAMKKAEELRKQNEIRLLENKENERQKEELERYKAEALRKAEELRQQEELKMYEEMAMKKAEELRNNYVPNVAAANGEVVEEMDEIDMLVNLARQYEIETIDDEINELMENATEAEIIELYNDYTDYEENIEVIETEVVEEYIPNEADENKASEWFDNIMSNKEEIFKMSEENKNDIVE